MLLTKISMPTQFGRMPPTFNCSTLLANINACPTNTASWDNQRTEFVMVYSKTNYKQNKIFFNNLLIEIAMRFTWWVTSSGNTLVECSVFDILHKLVWSDCSDGGLTVEYNFALYSRFVSLLMFVMCCAVHKIDGTIAYKMERNEGLVP